MAMKILVTAGNTLTPIDQVRAFTKVILGDAITNIFRGRTGTEIALELASFGHNVTLVTSSPELVPSSNMRLHKLPYKMFDQLAAIMESEIRNGGYDCVIHSAAVSDYKPTGNVLTLCVEEETASVLPNGFVLPEGYALAKKVPSGKKISSSYPTLLIETVQTDKLIDKIRKDWGFDGYVVKFKLQVGISDEELLAIARASRSFSSANLIVANCLEWSGERAYVVGEDGFAENVTRHGITEAIVRRIKR